LTARFEKTALSEKMIEKDLSRVEESATKSTYILGVGFERCEDKGEKSDPKFIPSSTYHKEKATIKFTKAHYPSNPKREIRKKPPSRERKFLFVCFVAVLVIWMSFASDGRELRGGVLSMLETHIVMSFLIFHLCLILVFCLTRTLVLRLTLFLVLLLALSHVLCLVLLLVLCFSSFMDPTIAHMLLVHERIDLSLDALVTTHVLIVVTISRVGLILLLEGHFPTLS
jgi:hypothetical protein